MKQSVENDLTKKMKPGDTEVELQHDIIMEFNKEYLADFLGENEIFEIEGFIRSNYNIPQNQVLHGLYLLPTNSSVMAFIYEDGILLVEKTQASIITPIINACITLENSNVIYPEADENEFEDFEDTEKSVQKVTKH